MRIYNYVLIFKALAPFFENYEEPASRILWVNSLPDRRLCGLSGRQGKEVDGPPTGNAAQVVCGRH